MNRLLEFVKNRENRMMISVGLFTVVVALLGMYYWQLLTGRVLLPQTLEQFPLTADQTAVRLWTEIEDQARYANNNPRNGDEFNVVVGIEYLQAYYFDQLDLNISYPYGDLQFVNWYSGYHQPSGTGPVTVTRLTDKDTHAGGNSQVLVLNIRKANIGKKLVGKEPFIILRFKRLTNSPTALQWYGNSTVSYRFTHTSPLVTYTLPVTGSHVFPAVAPGSDMCGGIQGLQCPSGKQCVYSNGSTTAPYPDASGTCQVVDPAIAQCLNNGGIEWRVFSNGCADRCNFTGEPQFCTMALTNGCDCGVDACWDGGKCVPNTGSGPSPVSWKTPYFEVTADDFYIRAFGQQFNAKNATVELWSDQDGAGSIAFDVKWMEAGKEMELLMSVRSNLSSWWVNEIRTKNGKVPAGWIYYKGSDYINTKYTDAAFGQPYMRSGDVEFYALDQAGDGKIYFKNLKITAFKTCTLQNKCAGSSCYNEAVCEQIKQANNSKIKFGDISMVYGAALNDVEFSAPMSLLNGGTQVKTDYDVWAYMPPFGSSGFKIDAAKVSEQASGLLMCENQSEGLNAWCSDVRIKGDGSNPAVTISGDITLADNTMRVLQVCARHPSDNNTYCKARQFTYTPGTGVCPLKSKGDANCNGSITLSDFEAWRQEYQGTLTSKTADFNGSGSVTLFDFEIWRQGYVQ